MVHLYRRRSVKVLFTMLITYFFVFLYGLWKLYQGDAVVEIGFSATTINMLIVVLSVVAIAKAVYELYGIEHHDEYEERIGKG